MSRTPFLTFVVPVRNDAEGLERCLASIRDSPGDPTEEEILVADNGSVDRSVEVARGMGARVLELPGLTVAALRNRAAGEARGEILAFVDADHEIDRGWKAAAVAALADPGVGAVGAPYSSPSPATWVQRIYDSLRDHRGGRRDVSWLGSGNLAVRKSCFDACGGFDETMTTCEDVDLCARLRERGLRVVADSRLRSVHHGDPATLGEVFRSELWRGQDNLRVTVRRGVSGREIPSLALSIVHLVSLGVLVAGALATPFGGAAVAMTGLAGAAAVTTARALRMAAHASPRGAADVARVLAVATTYETARALALVVRVPHRRAGNPASPA